MVNKITGWTLMKTYFIKEGVNLLSWTTSKIFRSHPNLPFWERCQRRGVRFITAHLTRTVERESTKKIASYVKAERISFYKPSFSGVFKYLGDHARMRVFWFSVTLRHLNSCEMPTNLYRTCILIWERGKFALIVKLVSVLLMAD